MAELVCVEVDKGPSMSLTDTSCVELRSDTFSLPTDAMRQAIASAVVGDDMVGEDPTVNALEARMCELLGKPASVYLCSGTQSNQAAVWAHCQPGDEMLIESLGHIGDWEGGGPAALRGVSVRRVQGHGGMLTLDDLQGRIRNPSQHVAVQTLLALENTTNMGGGRVWPIDQFADVCAWARNNGLKTHLDGARLFNAVVASGVAARDWCKHVDSVSVCFSKGLGCPMGSILAGSEETIAKARRARKIFGGALRQSGMMAAAALYAIDHHIDRLAEDHDNATRLVEGLQGLPNINAPKDEVETNMVFVDVSPDWGTAAEFAAKLVAHGVKLYDVGPQRLRAVLHLNVSSDDVDRAINAFKQVADGC